MSVQVTPLLSRDLPAADEIHRQSFATFPGLENPVDFEGDAQVIQSRFNAGNTWMAGAFRSGRMVGSRLCGLSPFTPDHPSQAGQGRG